MKPHERFVFLAALARLDECRIKCPGIGGDVDAMNLRAMIERRKYSPGAVKQAANRLAQLSGSLSVEASEEVDALLLFSEESDRFTLADAIAAFPILAGKPLSGIKSYPDRAPFISDGVAFVNDAHSHGGGAFNLAMMLCELTSANYGRGANYFDWSIGVGKLDSEHRAALAFVISRFIAQGGF